MSVNLVSEIDWRDHPKTLIERTASQSDLWPKQKWGYPVRFAALVEFFGVKLVRCEELI